MLNNISISYDKVNNGVWRKLFRSEFLIANTNSERFKQAIIDLGSAAVTEESLIRIMADTILLGWRNVKDPQGCDLAYTRDLAVVALQSSEDVRAFVDKVSTDLKYYCEQS